MSEKTGDMTFMRMAIGLMALTGLATIFHTVHEIYRDFKPKRENDKPARAYPPPRLVEPDEERYRRDDGPDSSWVHKARVSERPAEGERQWTNHASRQGQTRQH